MSQQDEFERAVAEFLQEGLHTRRGLSATDYTIVCQRAWDACATSEEFPDKVLIDPLRSPETAIATSTQEYVHWRAAEGIRTVPHESVDVYCHAIGTRGMDLATAQVGTIPLADEEPDVPEIRRYLLAVFDVLGFSTRLSATGLKGMTTLYDKLIEEAVMKEAMRTMGAFRVDNRSTAGTLFALPVRHTHFSDTIILWVPLVQHFISPFIARCADLICEALRLDLPLRGALAVGSAVLHSRTGTFIGQPIVEAARLEQAQNWIGASLGLSMLASDVSQEFDPNLILPYDAPTKPNKKHLLSGLAIDWPRRFAERFGDSPAHLLEAMNTSPSHARYYENTIAFAKISSGPIVRRDGMQPVNISDLAAATVDARSKDAPLSNDDAATLRDLSRAGATGSALAEFLNAITNGNDPPPLPTAISPALRRYLTKLANAPKGSTRSFPLNAIMIKVLTARARGSALTTDTLEVLAEIENMGPRASITAQFLRDLAGGNTVCIPKGALPEWRGFLQQGLNWANGKVPDGPLQHLANQCLRSRILGEALSHYDDEMLQLLETSGEAWPAVVAFLRDICDAQKHPEVPGDLPTTLQRRLTRIRYSASLAGVQTPRLLELMSLGIGDPCTRIDLFTIAHFLAQHKGQPDIPQEIETAISNFEAAAPERASAGQYLRALHTGDPFSEPPPGLPPVVYMLLSQLRAIAEEMPIPLTPQWVGWAAIRKRHGGIDIGDCLRFSLHAMLAGPDELQTLARYFCKLAEGGSAGPAPELSDPDLATIAQEMRTLAERMAGGFRALMSPANTNSAAPDVPRP